MLNGKIHYKWAMFNSYLTNYQRVSCLRSPTSSSLSLMRLAPNMSSKGSETALLAARVGPALGLMATLANNL